jgi:glucose/arabinose dehydrogenase
MFVGVVAVPLNAAQQGEHTESTVTAHVYETQKLKADASHLRKLRVPAGFRIQRFAEGLDNPRLIAVAGDGNRKSPSGYEVVRVRFDRDGKFSGFEPFMTGLLQQEGGQYGYVGRPVGLAIAKDGAFADWR